MFIMLNTACADQDGGGGGTRGSHPPSLSHLENHKAIGFLNNTDPDHLENHSIQCLTIISLLVKCHLNDESLTP